MTKNKPAQGEKPQNKPAEEFVVQNNVILNGVEYTKGQSVSESVRDEFVRHDLDNYIS